ncbi:hypothetical protein REPUB_Repub02eG0064100 [Reevesia pubescens]
MAISKFVSSFSTFLPGCKPEHQQLKPGVSKVTREEGSSIDIRHVTVHLPPPPCLSKSARFCVDDLQGVLPPLCQLQPLPRSSAKKGNANKQDDPFVAAYRKCTEYCINGKLDTDDKNDACKTRTKKNMFTLSCKNSCTVSSGNVVRVSQCSKEKAKEEQKENNGDAKLTGQNDVKCNQDKLN